jgi:DNA-binding Xre family transcriptional regulator
MYRKDLQSAAKISTTTLAKMSKGENLQTDVLLKICTALNCGIEDILEVIDCESANI